MPTTPGEPGDPPVSSFIGTPAFLPAILSQIRSSVPAPLPLDTVVFQSILLCLIAGDKNLILQTSEEDIPLVIRIAAWTLTVLFDLSTHKLKIRARADPAPPLADTASANRFLQSLFIPSTSNSFIINANRDSQGAEASPTSDVHQHHHHHRTSSHSHPRTRKFSNSVTKSRSTQFADWGTAPNEQELAKPLLPSPHEQETLTPPNTLRGGPLAPRFTLPPNRGHHPTKKVSQHGRLDAQPAARSEQSTSKSAGIELPQALVISGLENASIPSQLALARVLADRRVVLEGRVEGSIDDVKSESGFEDEGPMVYDGVWNLPKGFITVYVCPWNARERPTIHKSMLDKFAMSATVIVSKPVRDAIRTSISHSSSFHFSNSHSNPSTPSPMSPSSQTRTPPSFPRALPQMSSHPSVIHSPKPTYAHQNTQSLMTSPSSSSPHIPNLRPVLPPSFISVLQTAWRNTSIPSVLSLYLSDIFSAARHHHQLDGTLLSAKAMKDAEDLSRAGRVIGVDLTGIELITDPAPLGLVDDQGDDDNVDGRIEDDVQGGHVKVDSSEEKTLNGSHPPPLQRWSSSGRVGSDFKMEVSEADIARLVPRVISHRLRVRDGPEEEILGSARYGAVLKRVHSPGQDSVEGTTVKDVLISILAEV